MEIRRGIPVSAGYAIGEAVVLGAEEFRISRKEIGEKEIPSEVARFENARGAAQREFESALSKITRKSPGVAQILKAHITMLQDEAMNEEILASIRQRRHTAEYATSRILRRNIKMLEDSGQVTFREAARDLVEIEKALLRNLLGSKRNDTTQLKRKSIVVAHDLTPAQTLGLDREKILGLVTEVGGRTSHTAIVASSLGIPAVVGVEDIASDVGTGDTLILDGSVGTVIIHPDEATMKRYQAMERNFVLLERRLRHELRELPAETRDGQRVEILANIEIPDEIQAALEYGAEGIGLYRTEFLYLGRKTEPTESDHVEAYRRAAQALGGRKLVIRTLDLGADKMPLDGMPREENPFLGMRAVRFCLERPEIFKTQLRAILKLAPSANVHVMIPMVSSVSEVSEVREIVESVRRELRRKGEAVAERIPIGIMVEVPSAALTAEAFAKTVDFFSIGTNDLIGYTIAVDRQNERVAALYQPAHPAILRLLKEVIEAGARHNKPVSVCGEMSSDITYTLLLLGMGLKTYSVVPHAIPEIKKIIRSVTMEEARAIAKRAFEFQDAGETVEFLKAETRKIIPDAL